MNAVTSSGFAASDDVQAHFARKLLLETDCWDVHEAMDSGEPDFVLIDVRSPELFEKSHVPGAINLPHRKMVESVMSRWAKETKFVVYCAGPHCNGADKAALRLSGLGRPVKVMMGGVTGWIDEGFSLASGT
jgi:rhodanese-related sulfurtransferase